jgi:hypothetical protein
VTALARLRFIFMLKEASLEHDKCELRFESKKPSTFSFVFSGRTLSTGLEIAIVTLSWFRFPFLAPNGVQLNSEFHRVELFITDNCSEQAVHSVMRFPRSFYTDVQTFGFRSVLLMQKSVAEASSRGEVTVFILLLVAICVHC